MRFEDCEKAVKAMVEVKKSVDEETFNKMFKIFNEKYPDIAIMTVIHNVCKFNFFCSIIDIDDKMFYFDSYDVKTRIKITKPFITLLINFVVNLHTLNPNYPMFKCWKDEDNKYKDFQLPKK